ncbi:MAG: phage minor capsid protein [Gordonibacter sp.]
MLDPDYLEQAGEKVAGVYRQIEADMLDYLVAKMIEGDVSGQRAQTAIHRLAQNSAAPLMDIFGKYGKAIDAAVKLEITEALRLSNTDDLSRIKRGLGVDFPAITTRQIAATVAGAKEILERQNLLMAESARNAFLQQSLWAVTQVNTGTMTTEKALHAAVRRLEGDGISLITYRNTTTGMQSVQNKVDVAVRRHIRTQIAQDGMRLTELLMDEANLDLVEVSSHGGSRPSHAKWEGRVYSRNGDKIIDGVRYRDFKSACNWGDVADGIGGANCRHSYAAWFPGMERSYYPNPDHPSGKTNEEVYGLTQKQRTGERAIRKTKRELRGAEILYDETKSAEALGDATRLKIKLRGQQEKMRALIGDNPRVLQRSPRREWAGDMPKVKIPRKLSRDMMVAEPKNVKGVDVSKRTPKVDIDLIESAPYRKAFDFFDSEVGDTVCTTAREMLKHRTGTTLEDFAAISLSGNSITTRLVSSSTSKVAKLTNENKRAISGAKRGDLITLHNHPESMPPSFADFVMLRHKSIRYGVIACHDGGVFRYRITNRKLFEAAIDENRGVELDGFLTRGMIYFGTPKGDAFLSEVIERRFGVTYEKLT